ncbi:hypothetical protein ABF638_38180, partial [Nostoc sp. CALU 1950]
CLYLSFSNYVLYLDAFALAALGGKRFIGNPKQPTISVYALVEGEYQVTQFRGNDRIQSPTLRELNLTAEQVFQAALGQY